ncbi:MAG: hypothetical protein HY287_05460 [Planctomycetes bacterium]|nr:hypothetical protein [Planctomycetota bacterium]MBI3833758.1 hypothetical protein [Planctomycetota bacterium]
MSVEQDVSLRASNPLTAGRFNFAAPLESERTTPSAEFHEQLRGIGPRWLATAPGRINVIGGLSDYTGALVLHVPTATCVSVGVRRRDDAVISLAYIRENSDTASTTNFPLQRIYPGCGGWIDAETGASFLNGTQPYALRCVVGTLVEAVRGGVLPPFSDGLSIVVRSSLGSDDGEYGAVASATVVALGALFGATLDQKTCVEACRRALNEWVKSPVGPADILSALCAPADGIAEICCDSCDCLRSTPLSDALRIVGIRYADADAQSARKFADVRIASGMGRLLIERIITHDRIPGLQSNMHLARIAVNDYTGNFRDRLPTKLKGADFIKHFGSSSDPFATVNPSTVYKVRSRTEHHIYENLRAHEFVQALGRSIRTGQKSALTGIGELMTASHWSYGQRCGLGSPSADLLVNLIKKHGSKTGIHGAKIAGVGGGGAVCVALEPTDAARSSLQSGLDAFQTATGQHPKIIESGSIPGVLRTGAQSF